MNCYCCQGIDTFREVKTRYFSSSEEHTLFVDNFPVSECVQCGEQILSSAAMDVLDSIHDGKAHPVSFKTIPVFDHDDLAGDSRRSQAFPFAKMLDTVQVGSYPGTWTDFLVDTTLYTVNDEYPLEAFPKRTHGSPAVVVSIPPEVRYARYSTIRH